MNNKGYTSLHRCIFSLTAALIKSPDVTVEADNFVIKELAAGIIANKNWSH